MIIVAPSTELLSAGSIVSGSGPTQTTSSWIPAELPSEPASGLEPDSEPEFAPESGVLVPCVSLFCGWEAGVQAVAKTIAAMINIAKNVLHKRLKSFLIILSS